MSNLEYTPPGTLRPFFESDKFVSLVMGPIGSGKTSAQLLKIAYEAQKMAKCSDGIRRSRCVIVRNTRQIINDSTLKDFMKWYPEGEAGDYARTEMKYTLRFNDVVCEVLFRGLDTPDDTRRLLSTQFSFGIIEEFRELDPSIYEALAGRVGRYPDKVMVPPRAEWGKDAKGNPIGGCVDDNGQQMKKLWGASNPPVEGSFWHGILTEPPSNLGVIVQPSGLSEEADWIKYLDTNYYEDLVELHGGDEEWISVNIHGEFGRSLSGQPVWPSFDSDTHVAKAELKPSTIHGTLWVGIDNGLTPSAVIGQVDYQGRVLIYDSVTSSGMGALRFCREVLKPLLVGKYSGFKVQLIADPACRQRAQTDEKTIVDIYKAEGLSITTAGTNLLVPRIAAVDKYLTRTIEGKASLLIDPSCGLLIKALRGGYRYKVNTKGEVADTPEKSHPISDIADALQYLCLHADGGSVYGADVKAQARKVLPAPYVYA